MNCQEVQPALSEYIEKSLDAVRTKAVETHLLSCAPCRAEVDDLISCIEQVAELPWIEPPLGFAQRVMAHVREIEPQRNLWHRMFAALKTSAALRATAVVSVAVLAVLLYQREHRIWDNEAQPLAPISSPVVSLNDASNAVANPTAESPTGPVANTKAAAARTAAGESVNPESRQRKVAQGPSLKSNSKPETPASPEPPSVPQAENTAGDVRNPFPRRGAIQAQEVATGTESLRPSGDPFGISPSLGGSLRPGFFLPERSLSPITEPSADAEFMVRRRQAQRRDQNVTARSESARESAENGIAPATAKQSIASPSSQMIVREIRWFAVPADQYDQFRRDLASEASIESEKAVGPSEREFALKSNRELLIKVVIVSPAER